QLADAGVGDEALLAVEDPFLAVTLRLELEAGLGVVRRQPIVGPRTRLANALAEEEGVILQERLEEAPLLLLAAGGRDQMAPLPALAEGLGDGAVALGELRHHQRLGDEIGAVPAPFLGHRHGAKAELGAFLDDLPVEDRAGIVDVVALE